MSIANIDYVGFARCAIAAGWKLRKIREILLTVLHEKSRVDAVMEAACD